MGRERYLCPNFYVPALSFSRVICRFCQSKIRNHRPIDLPHPFACRPVSFSETDISENQAMSNSLLVAITRAFCDPLRLTFATRDDDSPTNDPILCLTYFERNTPKDAIAKRLFRWTLVRMPALFQKYFYYIATNGHIRCLPCSAEHHIHLQANLLQAPLRAYSRRTYYGAIRTIANSISLPRGNTRHP